MGVFWSIYARGLRPGAWAAAARVPEGGPRATSAGVMLRPCETTPPVKKQACRKTALPCGDWQSGDGSTVKVSVCTKVRYVP